jgi:ribonuclease HI
MSNKVVMYTDGACRGNPGPGGWGVVLSYQDNRKTLHDVEIYTDSKYVMQGISDWISNWKRNGWKTAAKKPVKNYDLWQLLDKEVAEHSIDWNWVKGHSGIEGNELADQLANAAIDAEG